MLLFVVAPKKISGLKEDKTGKKQNKEGNDSSVTIETEYSSQRSETIARAEIRG